MDKYDAQAECVRALQGRGRRPKRNAEVYRFNCLRHDDRNGDAWVGVARHGCFACTFEEPIATLCEALGLEPPRSSNALTVEELCERKGFSLDVVTSHGWRTTTGRYGDVVEIPYYDAERSLLRAKHRTRTKTFWAPGTGTYLYGLHVLAKNPPDAEVILAEGETDPMACFHKGVLAVGVPGATAWKREWAPLLSGRRVYIWQEPGPAGVEFAQKITTDFPDAKIIRGGV